jgi:hypothetical protein
MARPRKELNWIELDKLCLIHATRKEISDWFECSEDTIDRRCQEEFGISFAAYYDQKSVNGKMSLRRKQYEQAMCGNTTMLLWLGKQYLGQKDKQEVSTDPQSPIQQITLNYVPKSQREK